MKPDHFIRIESPKSCEDCEYNEAWMGDEIICTKHDFIEPHESLNYVCKDWK